VVNNAAFNNGEWAGPLIHSHDEKVFRHSTGYLPYTAGKRNKVLVLNAGTGTQIIHALAEGTESVTAVEPDKNLLELLSKNYADLVDSVYNDPRVHIENIYSRSFLISADSKFDLIQVPVIDAFGGTSGLYSLKEQYMLTKEAFGEMYSMLTNDGVICISTWIDYPYKNPLKIIATIAETLYETGIKNIASRTAAVKNWNTLTIIIKRSALDKDEVDKIRTFCREMKFDPVILPGIKNEERDFYNRLQDKSFYYYIDQLLEYQEKREEFYSNYLFEVRPATDNKPYFSQFLKWESISRLSEAFGNQSVPFFEVGYILLYLTFFQMILSAVILIILPLFKIGWKGQNKPRTLFYFSGLGLGYMFVEIVLIQKFTLYFGNVIYSAAAVVSLMLIASGVGSLFSQKMKALRSRLIWILLFIGLSLILYSLILTPLLKITIVLSLPVKIIFAALLITPPAFFMGMPFPLGLRLLSSKVESAGDTAWAWGINGVFSVAGAVLATVIALELGFTWVMVFAATAYLIAMSANAVRG
jgi:spermidine synthase